MAVMMLRNSERQTFKKCEHRWQWTYRDGREAREAANALRFGNLIHLALADYYVPGVKRGEHPAEAFVRHYNEDAQRAEEDGFSVWDDDKWRDALDLGRRMLEGYVNEYEPQEAGRYEVVSPEQTFQLLVRTPHPIRLFPHYQPAVLRFKVVGTFDGVWRDLERGTLFFKEFKTASAIKFDGLPLDEQAGLYWTYGPRWLLKQGLLQPGETISHIEYTFLRKSARNPDDVYSAEGLKLNKPTKDALIDACAERDLPTKGTIPDLTARLAEVGVKVPLLGEPSASQPAPYFARTPVYRDRGDRERMHNRVLQEAVRIAQARLRADEENVKNPGPLHMPNCLGCPVRDACEVHETGGDFQPVLDAATRPWNPYAAHELPERV